MSPELVDYADEMRRHNLAPTTINTRLGILTRCEQATGRPLIQADVTTLRAWLDQLTIGPRSTKTYINHLSAFWAWATLEERSRANPTARLSRPRTGRLLPRPLLPAELARLHAAPATPPQRAMIALGLYAGLRCMEIAGLHAEHIEGATLLVAHGKGDKWRRIPIPQPLVDALAALEVDTGPLFTGTDEQALPAWKVSHLIRAHLWASGVKGSAHQLRHTYASELYRRADLRLAQEMLGHASPATTAIYAQWDQGRAAAVIDTLFT